MQILDYIEQVVKHLLTISDFPLVGAEHLVDATQNTDAYTEVSAALKVCMMNMSKIANDLRLMASGPRVGLAEIHITSSSTRFIYYAGESKSCYGRSN